MTTGCMVAGCERSHYGRGYCQGHLTRVRRHGDPQVHIPLQVRLPNGPVCSVDGCSNEPHARALCSGHLTRLRKHGDVLADVPLRVDRYDVPCSVEGCETRPYANGFCRLHDRRVKTHGQPEMPIRSPRPPCSVPSCGRTVRAGDYCGTHAERIRVRGSLDPDRPVKLLRPDLPCDLEGCERPHYSLGFCVNHYSQRVSRPRRIALEAAALGSVTAEQLQSRIDYYGGRCWMCAVPWTCIDHVKPLAAGGSNWPSNLRPACTSCNARKQHHWPYPTTTRKAA